MRSTDISKVTRKLSRTGKHGLEKRKSSIEAKDAKPKPEENVNPSVIFGQTLVIRTPKGCYCSSSPYLIYPAVKSKGVSKLKGTDVNSRARLQDGKVRLVISKALSSSKQGSHASGVGESTKEMGVLLLWITQEK
ncbi:hypothetical protein Tco_1329975 [Tanacetum coccineum]